MSKRSKHIGIVACSAEGAALCYRTICMEGTALLGRHEAFDLVVNKSPIPWLHIAQEVAAEAKRKEYKCLGVLGTRYLMEGPVYPSKITAVGIEHMIPEVKDRERINQIIFDELVNARFTSEALAYFKGVVNELKNKGCDAVILGCTEIPLLVTQENSPLPILDSTRLLARAALKKAISSTSG